MPIRGEITSSLGHALCVLLSSVHESHKSKLAIDASLCLYSRYLLLSSRPEDWRVGILLRTRNSVQLKGLLCNILRRIHHSELNA